MSLTAILVLLIATGIIACVARHARTLKREHREFGETGRVPPRWIIGRITSAPGHKRSQTNEHP